MHYHICEFECLKRRQEIRRILRKLALQRCRVTIPATGLDNKQVLSFLKYRFDKTLLLSGDK